jgi:uncharacterized phage protein (TIGR02218 family)
MVTLASPEQRAELLARSAHTHARLFRLARKDGFVVRLTDHSAPIEFDGESYPPSRSAIASAVQSRGGLAASSLDAQGVITSDLITEADLRAGRYRGAEVLEMLVDWEFPFYGAIEVQRMWVQGTRQDGATWEARCGGLTSRLESKIGRLLERDCWKSMGDLATCKFDVVPVSDYYAPISDVINGRQFRVASLGSTRPSGHFVFGQAIWRSGANEGLEGLVIGYDEATQLVSLAVQMPLPVAVGDRVDLIIGCSRKKERCSQLGNYVNFGGLTFLTSTDEQLKPATS